jgi:hypothetical protein
MMIRIETTNYGISQMKLLKRLKKLIKPAIDYSLKPGTLLDALCDDLAGELSCLLGTIPLVGLVGTYISLINTIPL